MPADYITFIVPDIIGWHERYVINDVGSLSFLPLTPDYLRYQFRNMTDDRRNQICISEGLWESKAIRESWQFSIPVSEYLPFWTWAREYIIDQVSSNIQSLGSCATFKVESTSRFKLLYFTKGKPLHPRQFICYDLFSLMWFVNTGSLRIRAKAGDRLPGPIQGISGH